jgi:hypothetical protein
LNPRKPKRGASFEMFEFEALLDPVDPAPQQVVPSTELTEAEPEPEVAPEVAPQQVVEVPSAPVAKVTSRSRFDAAGTDDDRLPVHGKRPRRRR